MRRPLAALAGVAMIGLLSAVATSANAAPTAWTVPLHTGSKGQAGAQTVPAAPASITATCSLVSLQITVSWAAVTHASSYTVYQSTSGATGTYSVVASGVATTSWTSGILLLGTYTYKVSATIGSNWTTAQSVASTSHTITVLLCT